MTLINLPGATVASLSSLKPGDCFHAWMLRLSEVKGKSESREGVFLLQEIHEEEFGDGQEMRDGGKVEAITCFRCIWLTGQEIGQVQELADKVFGYTLTILTVGKRGVRETLNFFEGEAEDKPLHAVRLAIYNPHNGDHERSETFTDASLLKAATLAVLAGKGSGRDYLVIEPEGSLPKLYWSGLAGRRDLPITQATVVALLEKKLKTI